MIENTLFTFWWVQNTNGVTIPKNLSMATAVIVRTEDTKAVAVTQQWEIKYYRTECVGDLLGETEERLLIVKLL